MLTDTLIKKIISYNAIVKYISGANENLNFAPAELLLNYSLVCKLFKRIIDEDKAVHGENVFGLKHAKEAALLHHPLKEKVLTQQDFNGIKKAAEAMIATYPIEKNHYISLGNSPTPITTYLQQIKSNAEVTHLPMGGIPDGVNSVLDWETNGHDFSLYFDTFLKKAITHFEEGKDIVVIDYVESGASIRAARDHIVQYLVKKELEKQLPNYLKPVNSLDKLNHENLFQMIIHRVKIFSLLSPNSIMLTRSKDIRNLTTLAEKHPMLIELPKEANAGLRLDGDEDLVNLYLKLHTKFFKEESKLTLFESKKYASIKQKDLTVSPTFGNHLRLTALLAYQEKKKQKEEVTSKSSCNLQ